MRAPALAKPLESLLGAQAIEDPHALHARLRAEQPLVRIGESGVHIASTWALIDEALRREGDFSAHLTGVLVQGEEGEPSIFALAQDRASQVIATADEPEHAVHRALLQPRLAARRIDALEPELRKWVQAALAPLRANGRGDFVPIAERVPARALARLLGLPGADVERFRQWSMMGGDILAGAIDAERLVALAAETGQMAQYLSQHLEAALEQTRSDIEAPLLHVLARAVHDERITRQQALGIAIILFGAGGESTAALLGSAVRLLAEQPALAKQLREAPELITRFVEEVVRLEPPFKFHYRVVRRSCELGGFELVKGDRLMLAWASANRDPQIFDAPDDLRLDRRHPRQHMGFGRGVHFCVGAPLARLEARVTIEGLLASTSRIGLAPGELPVHTSSIFVRRLERLIVDLE